MIKIVSPIIASLLILQSLAPQAVRAQSARNGATDDSVNFNGKVKLKSVGPLHMDNGAVVFKQHDVTVLSDDSDSPADAELVGRTFGVHMSSKDGQPAVSGIALFTKGFSISALTDPKTDETVILSGGRSESGHIIDATDESVHIKDGLRTKSVPTKEITAINSPRCYYFTLPVSTQAIGAPEALDQSRLVTFSSTYMQPPVGVSSLLPSTSMLQGQLTQTHMVKKVFVYSLGAAAFCACFAVPIALAISTPKQLSDIKAAVAVVKRNRDSGVLK